MPGLEERKLMLLLFCSMSSSRSAAKPCASCKHFFIYWCVGLFMRPAQPSCDLSLCFVESVCDCLVAAGDNEAKDWAQSSQGPLIFTLLHCQRLHPSALAEACVCTTGPRALEGVRTSPTVTKEIAISCSAFTFCKSQYWFLQDYLLDAL